MARPVSKEATKWWEPLVSYPLVILLLVTLPLLLAVAVLAVTSYLVYTICLHILIWARWCARGQDVLFVYSDSPIWHDYLQQSVLPHISSRAITLNWSQRKRWKRSLATAAFRHFGGYREFNPMAVVFRPFRRSRTFRFWKPFHEFKHGNTEPVDRMVNELLRSIGARTQEPA